MSGRVEVLPEEVAAIPRGVGNLLVVVAVHRPTEVVDYPPPLVVLLGRTPPFDIARVGVANRNLHRAVQRVVLYIYL